jgi:hypothetical protein
LNSVYCPRKPIRSYPNRHTCRSGLAREQIRPGAGSRDGQDVRVPWSSGRCTRTYECRGRQDAGSDCTGTALRCAPTADISPAETAPAPIDALWERTARCTRTYECRGRQDAGSDAANKYTSVQVRAMDRMSECRGVHGCTGTALQGAPTLIDTPVGADGVRE